ncbi:non-ribosomal peptide synthetase [Microlunatus soli]|uniref:Amino acid adenylation domain-containing protein n=1 Tax=Microlunatus soli TaxID=630515 RepID=A0A1H1VSF6_9ACTN|nr:non-ribosomal peptide synthetase [Microlunatus soli]SDS87827.1 amino acid adenylation domain-containing protein [Microlunatus soli]
METTLTPGQHDALVDSLLRPDDPIRNGAVHRILASPTSTAAVDAAWRHVVAANPYLTTTPVRHGSSTVPELTPTGPVPEFVVHPTDGGSTDTPARPSITLTDGRPLCRLRGIGSPRVRRLVLEYHEVLLDSHAAHALLAEVIRVADGGAAEPLPAIGDYFGWYAEQDQSRVDTFWQQRFSLLDGATPLLDEARREPRPTARLRHGLASEAQDRLRDLAHRLGVPEQWLALLAWSVIVCRFRGGESSAIGVLADVRPDGLPSVLGNFELVLPHVVEFDSAPTEDWLRRQVTEIRELIHHGHLSSARRNDLSGTERGTTLFDSVVDLRSDPHGSPSGQGGAAVPLRVRSTGDSLLLDHDPTMITTDQADRLLRCTVAVLSGLADGHHSGDIRSLSLLDDQQAVDLGRHNATAADYPTDRCLHQLVEAQVDQRPDEVALVYENNTLTYRELDERANRLAHELIARGVRPDSIVGLCSEPSLELCVGILAIHKAGAGYAPLDPFFPEERLSYLFGDLNCSVVLCQRSQLDRLPSGGRTLVLDEPEQWAARPAHRPAPAVAPDNLAYVMYTSGSTGRPKGVLIEHGGAVNFLWWMRQRFELGPGEAALQWTAYSFDAAVWELFWPLVVGGRAVIAPAKIHLDLERFIDLITDNEVVTLHFVPAMLQTFLSAPKVSRCTTLRHVFVSGEPVPVSLMDRFHELLSADLINLYGVTEVSIDSTYYVCERDADFAFVRSGTPLSNTQTYVLDESLRRLPFGARGEVFIGGDSVTRGYLGRRGLTAERFVPDPFGPPGRRLYRTGDVAQLLPDGHLRFLGRSDHQVKIRGIRVELLEVAGELNDCPGVRESLVVAFGEGSERGLAAYVVAETGTEIDPDQIRRFMGGRVPPYMVPNAIIALPEFPLNNNGKIDRKALPAPNEHRSSARHDKKPVGRVQLTIAEIWCRLLELPQVSVDQEFFAVGGNSLLATQVIADVRRVFDINLPLREWLEASTIEQLAAAVERRLAEGSDQDVSNAALQLLDELSADAELVESDVRAG